MRMMLFKKSHIASLLAAASFGAHGAGLGELRIKSALGERLNAEIDLIAVANEELSSLDAKLAAVDAYSQRDLRFDPALLGSRVAVLRRSNGAYYLRITSNRPINEPFIDILIEMSWGGGQLVRAYSSFIDPTGYVAGVQVARAPSPTVIAVAPSASASPTEVRPTPEIREPLASVSSVAPSSASNEPIQPAATDQSASNGAPPQTVESIVADASAVSGAMASMGNESDESRATRLAEIANESAVGTKTNEESQASEQAVVAPVSESDTEAVAASANPPRLSQAPRNTSATVRTDQAKRVAPIAPAARQTPKPRPKDVLQLAATEVRTDPARAAEEKAIAEQIRSLEERVRAKQIELSETDAKIADIKARNLAAGIRPMDEQNIARKGPLRDADQNAGEMVPTSGKSRLADGNTMTVAGGSSEALTKGSQSGNSERNQTVAVASTPVARVLAPKGATLPTAVAEEESLLDDPLVLGGGALALAVIGGLGTWRLRRRRAAAA